MIRHEEMAVQAVRQRLGSGRDFLNLHGGNVAGVRIGCHQHRAGRMVVCATGTVAMVMPGAGIAMLMSMVMRAAFAMLVMVLTFGGVVVRAAFAMLVLVFSFGGVVVRAAFAVLVLVFSFGGVVVRAAFAMLVLVLTFGGVVVLVLSTFGGVVVRAAFAVLVLVLSTFGGVLVLVLTFGGVVVRAAFAVLVLVFSTFGGVLVVAAGTMHMAGVILHRKLGGISDRGYKAQKQFQFHLLGNKIGVEVLKFHLSGQQFGKAIEIIHTAQEGFLPGIGHGGQFRFTNGIEFLLAFFGLREPGNALLLSAAVLQQQLLHISQSHGLLHQLAPGLHSIVLFDIAFGPGLGNTLPVAAPER